MRKKVCNILALVLTMCMLLTIFTACGGSKDSSENDGQKADSSENTDSAKDTGEKDSGKKARITAMVWCPDIPEETQSLIDKFMEKYPNIEVDLQPMVGSIAQMLQPKAASDSMPEFMSIDGSAFGASLADAGQLADISETDAWKNTLDSLKPDWISEKGVHYGIPGGLCTTLFYYNKDLFDKAGIKEVPQDWESFLEVCETLKKNNIVPVMWPGGDPNTIANAQFSYGMSQYVVNEDADYRKKIKEGNFSFDTDGMAEVFRMIKAIPDKGYCQEGFISTDHNTGVELFVQGDVAMIFHGTWLAGTLTQTDFNVGTFLPPWNRKGEEKIPCVSSETGWAVSEKSENKDAAIKLLEFWNGEGFTTYQNPRMCVPHLKSDTIKGEVKLPSQITKTLDEIAGFEKANPLYFAYLPANTIGDIKKIIQEVLINQKTPEEAAKVLDKLAKDGAKK